MLFLLILGFCWSFVAGLPVVDKGVFVITGVHSCRSGQGYCILGSDCTVDKEFIPDPLNGHCDGLRKAFTPRAYFSCCSYIENVTTTTTFKSVDNSLSVESVESSSVEESTVGTTTIIYDEKTEINIEESISLQVGCGANRDVRIGGGGEIGRVGGGEPTTCWTAAITRRQQHPSPPSSLHPTSPDPGTFLCTGAIIHRNRILTTATCISRLLNQDLNNYSVILNSKKLIRNQRLENGRIRNIKELIVHEEYRVVGGVRFNDVGIIVMEEEEEEDGYCMICLPGAGGEEDGLNGSCFVSGYSHPSEATTSSTDGQLHEATQLILPTCNQTNTQLCVYSEPSTEACFSPRDSGSPLACLVRDNYQLFGLFSSGFHCGSLVAPVHYLDVRLYLGWIRGKLVGV